MNIHADYGEVQRFYENSMRFWADIQTYIEAAEKSTTDLACTNSMQGKVADRMRQYVQYLYPNRYLYIRAAIKTLCDAFTAYRSKYTDIDSSDVAVLDTDELNKIASDIDGSKSAIDYISQRVLSVSSSISHLVAVNTSGWSGAAMEVFEHHIKIAKDIQDLIQKIMDAEHSQLSNVISVKEQIAILDKQLKSDADSHPAFNLAQDDRPVETQFQLLSMDGFATIMDKVTEEVSPERLETQFRMEEIYSEIRVKKEAWEKQKEKNDRAREAFVEIENAKYWSHFNPVPVFAERNVENAVAEWTAYVETGEHGHGKKTEIANFKRNVCDCACFTVKTISLLDPSGTVGIIANAGAETLHNTGYEAVGQWEKNGYVNWEDVYWEGGRGVVSGTFHGVTNLGLKKMTMGMGELEKIKTLTGSSSFLDVFAGNILQGTPSLIIGTPIKHYGDEMINSYFDGAKASDKEGFWAKSSDGFSAITQGDYSFSGLMDEFKNETFKFGISTFVETGFDIDSEYRNTKDRGSTLAKIGRGIEKEYYSKVTEEVADKTYQAMKDDSLGTTWERLKYVFDPQKLNAAGMEAAVTSVPKTYGKIEATRVEEAQKALKENNASKPEAIDPVKQEKPMDYEELELEQDRNGNVTSPESLRRSVVASKKRDENIEIEFGTDLLADRIYKEQISDRKKSHGEGYESHDGAVQDEFQQRIDDLIDEQIAFPTTEREAEIKDLIVTQLDEDGWEELAVEGPGAKNPMVGTSDERYREIQAQVADDIETMDPHSYDMSATYPDGSPRILLRYADKTAGIRGVNGRFFSDPGTTVDEVAIKGKTENIQAHYFKLNDTLAVTEDKVAPVDVLLPTNEKEWAEGANRPGGGTQYVSEVGAIDATIEGKLISCDKSGNEKPIPREWVDEYRNTHGQQLPESFLRDHPEYR